MLADLTFSFRQLVKSPGFTFIAVFTLAIGIGANTAIFSLINGLLINPLPFPESNRLIQIGLQFENGFGNTTSGGIYLDIKNHATQLESIGAQHGSNYNLTGIDEPLRLSGLEVSGDYIETIGIPVSIGRGFTEEDNVAGGENRVVILSDIFWKTQFASDPNLIDSYITLNDQAYRVIGILPAASLLVDNVDYLIPAAIEAESWKQRHRYDYVTSIIARMKEGASLESVNTELRTLQQNFIESYPDFLKDPVLSAKGLQESTYGNTKPYALTLFIAVSLVLLVACTNVANLLLARASSRQGEIAVRSALGAPGWKIARQLLTESTMLSLIGGGIGLVLGLALIEPLAILVDLNTRETSAISIDNRVLLFTLGVSLMTGILFGAFPAYKAIRFGSAYGLKDATRSATSAKGNKLQSVLIVSEVAMTVVLLISIGLLLKSLTNAMQTDPGFRKENVLTFEIARSNTKAPTNEAHVRFTDRVIESLLRIPGVANAAMVSTTPMNNQRFFGSPFWRNDLPDTANTYNTGFDSVNGDLFGTLGIPLLRGRSIERSDQNESSPKVLVINNQVVEDQFQEEDPIGHMVHHNGELWEVVGVVSSINRFSLDSGPQAMVYKPQVHWPWHSSYVVKTYLPPLELIEEVKAAVFAIDPHQPLDRIRSLEAAVQESIRGRTTMITLIGIFGVVAAFLAAFGIFALMSYLVGLRQREIGIRLAIGAIPRSIVNSIFLRGLRLSIIGIVIGTIVVTILGRYLAFLLYEVQPYDPIVLAGITGLTLAITALACWRPASAASNIRPSEALRLE